MPLEILSKGSRERSIGRFGFGNNSVIGILPAGFRQGLKLALQC